jgi:ribosome-associated protein
MSSVAMSAAEVRSTGPASNMGDVRSRTYLFETTLGAGRHKRRKALHLTMTFESGRTDMSTPMQASVSTDLAADLLDTVLASLDDSKAEDLVTLEIAAKSSLADHMVIVSGRSHRHVGAIADHLLKDLKLAGMRSAKVEGQSTCDWVLVDAGDVIIHIFRPEVRGFYNLEKMWAPETDDAPQFVG